ncbi:DUF1304 domain-containing protein [Actinokineospora sp.]|uniref:DUF1304 domain-containing protein n=1 Tax=Actinokineospora sp. TaxID=1872133 RepID=UPI004037A990
MELVAKVFVGLVVVTHLYFLVLEMFLWKTPFGRKTFNTTPEFAEESASLAANQGLYNGFLAAGLVFALIAGGAVTFPVTLFFLSCVIVAGLYGAATVSPRILVIQALPAGIAMALTLAA